jgi:hypothetical protein
MIMPSDQDYIETKGIIRGRGCIKPEFKSLADWIDKVYGVKTINIIYDTIGEGRQPRLQICFEYSREKVAFNEAESHSLDPGKQKAIANKFKETIREQGLVQNNGLFGIFKRFKTSQYKVDDVFVFYGDFESIARIEANQSIPQEKFDSLKTQIDNPEIWEISRMFSGATFFLHTDEQVKRYQNSKIHSEWSRKYFELLSPYDEFRYFKKESFSVYLDSKENFDINYESNWYYYYK